MTKKKNIKKLIASCKKQEWAAQKELYLLFADEMMSIAIRYASDINSAKDLVQETFLIFFKKIDQYDENKGALGAWLRRILINKSYAFYHKNKRLDYDGDEIATAELSAETSAIELLEAEDIIKLIQQLPEGCRIIFNLKVVEGYSHKEIGEMLDITASASRSQLSRAKQMLRNMITASESMGQYENQYYKQTKLST